VSMTRGLAALAIFVGALWTGQGLGWIGGSFMTGNLLWTWIGLAVIVAGVLVLLRTRSRKG
jgi:hypothetical protein